MQTTTFISTCLTFDKLKAYSEHTVSRAESELLYMHISTCELCACAVNGFSAIPFSSAEIIDLNKRVDVKSNAMIAQSLTVSQVFIIMISLLSIFGVYVLSNKISKNNINERIELKEYSSFSPDKNEMHENEIADLKTNENELAIVNSVKPKMNEQTVEYFERNTSPIATIESKEVALYENPKVENDIIPFIYNSDIIYVHDLKVTEYNTLYFTSEKQNFDYKNYTSSFKENEKTIADDFSVEEQSHEAHQLIKQGLYYFNKEKYSAALENFNLLIHHSKNDINANFYGALCYYNIGKANKAIGLLSTVLESKNNTFYPEAQWNLALCYLKQGDKENAKIVLEKIVSEKGFYTKKAGDKLKQL